MNVHDTHVATGEGGVKVHSVRTLRPAPHQFFASANEGFLPNRQPMGVESSFSGDVAEVVRAKCTSLSQGES